MPKLMPGFTLVETLIVISILIIIVSIVVPSFGKIGDAQALDTTVVSLISVLNEAKSQAVSSKEASSYGVRILNNKLISFKGNDYISGTNFKEVTISNLVTISTTTCSNCSDIVFNNISGSTSASGTITVTVLNDLTKYSKIKIYPTGLIERN